MNKKILIYLTFIGLIGLLFSCEKDGTQAVLSDNPIVPTIQSVPSLSLKRANGLNVLEFVGTPLDPGFQASTLYYLEFCAKGNNFQNPTVVLNDKQDLSMKVTVSDLNGLFLAIFPADQVTSVDFRIRSVLSLSNGTGSFTYSSPVKTVDITPYGLPRLDLVNSGISQKLQSALGDGIYVNVVKLDATKPFTLNDPDANIVYGGKNGVLSANGSVISVAASGTYKLIVNTKTLTYTLDPFAIGLIGDATPNGWNTPDQKMVFDPATGKWSITIALTTGKFKFRLNDDWGWNLGGTPDNLTQGGADCPVNAGTYTITLSILNFTTGTYTIVKS